MTHTRTGEAEIGLVLLILFCVFLAFGGIGGCMWVQPNYSVWSSQKSGEAKYAEAESTRRVTVLEAQAKLDSAKMLAQAEVERAKGVAEANRIIGTSLQGNELYLHYLWINNLHEGKNDVIYIPTEAGIPIMEAGKRPSPPK
jgi:regulator of protease activity HflC (stomatin/prohibitin superfamily)